MNGYYALLADQSRALILRREKRFGPLEPVQAFIHSEGRLRAGELVRDQRGTTFASKGFGEDAYQSPTPPKEAEAQRFARELAAELNQIRNRKKLERIVLVAPPRFLGHLRDALDPPTRSIVVSSIDKNLVTANIEQITQTLDEGVTF